jgi:hypothetical protein
MIKKFLIFLFFLGFLIISNFVYAGDYETSYYKLIVPSEGSRNWSTKVSKDVITIDTVLYLISQDVIDVKANRVSREASVSRLTVDTSVTFKNTSSTSISGGIVGRMTIISSDGSTCYIPLYNS